MAKEKFNREEIANKIESIINMLDDYGFKYIADSRANDTFSGVYEHQSHDLSLKEKLIGDAMTLGMESLNSVYNFVANDIPKLIEMTYDKRKPRLKMELVEKDGAVVVDDGRSWTPISQYHLNLLERRRRLTREVLQDAQRPRSFFSGITNLFRDESAGEQ